MLTETARLRTRYGLCGAWPAGYGERELRRAGRAVDGKGGRCGVAGRSRPTAASAQAPDGLLPSGREELAASSGILANARATAEPMGARCLPDSSSSSTARIPSLSPASGRLLWDTCLSRPPQGSLPATTGGAISGFPTLSWESARTASSIPAVEEIG